MQSRLLKLLFSLALLSAQVLPAHAWANAQLVKDSTSGQNQVVIEPQPNIAAQELEVELAVAIAENEHEPIVIETKKGNRYQFPYVTGESYPGHIATEQESRLAFVYEKLTADEQILFQENRLFFLTRAATILDRSELVVGFGKLVKNKLRVVKNIFKKKNPIDEAAKAILPDDQETPKTIRLQGRQIVAQLLHSFDRQLWAAAPIVAKQNEFAVSAGLNVILEGGAASKGAGGSTGIGINLGFNRDTKALVFEIYTEIDKFNYAITPFMVAGITPKLGFIMKDQSHGVETRARAGKTFYPPAMPGFFMTTQDMMIMGFSTSAFAFPPIIGDAFSYINSTIRKPILRMTFSSFNKKFIRIQTGIPEQYTAKVGRVRDIVRDTYRYTKQLPLKCMSFLKHNT